MVVHRARRRGPSDARRGGGGPSGSQHFEADEQELAALGVALGVPYQTTLLHSIDEGQSIDRVPELFVRQLAELTDVPATARTWQARCASMGQRSATSLEATLTELREFAASAIEGPGIVVYRQT